MASTDLITLDEARKALRLPASDNTNDTDLEMYVSAVTEPVEDVIGPGVSQSFTRNFDGGRNSIVLLGHGGVSVTAVTESGNPLTADSDYVVDTVAGILMRGTYLAPRPFFYGRQNIVVTWTAGPFATTASVSPTVKLAARIILRHLWISDQPGRAGGGGSGEQMASTPSGFAIPARAMELLNNRDRTPGFA